MYINILQIDPERDRYHKAGKPFSWLTSHFSGVDTLDYELMFEGEVDADTRSGVFRLLDLGGSVDVLLSVSDVVLIDNGERWEYYYKDVGGYVEFDPEEDYA